MRDVRFISDCLRRNYFIFLLLSIVFFASAFFTYGNLTLRGPGYSSLSQFYNDTARKIVEETGNLTTSMESAMVIFSNNTRMYWDFSILVRWLLPLLGLIIAVMALLLNGGLLGFAMTGIHRVGTGIFLALILPHGIVEIPAAIFEYSAIVNWQIGILRLMRSVVSGSKFKTTYFKDALILSILSVTMFFIAATLEIFVTSRIYANIYKMQ